MLRIVICTAAVLTASALALSGCSTAAARGHVALECAVAADLSLAMKADNVDPKAAGKDCKAVLAAANVPMLPLKKPNDPKDAPGLTHVVQFKTVKPIDIATVRVTLDYTCNVWCGHGEEIVARKENGHWVIADRKTTWVS